MDQVLLISLITGLLTALFYAVQGITEGVSARHVKYYELAVATQLFALVFMAVLAIVFGFDIRISTEALAIAALLGLVYAVSLHFYFRALHTGPMSIVSPISGSYSLVAVPVAVLLLGEVLTLWQFFGIGLTVIGVFLVNFKMRHHSVKFVRKKYLIYALITLFLWGIYMPIDSILIDKSSWYAALFWELIFVNIFLALMLLRHETAKSFSRSLSKMLKPSIVIGLCEVLGGLVMNYGLAKGSVAIITPLITTSTILVVLYAVIFMRQKLHRQQAFGVLFAVLGIIVLGA